MNAVVETIVERADADCILLRFTVPAGTALTLELTRDEAMRFSNHLGGAIKCLTPTEVFT
jgi:hypothetical protein